MKISAVSFDADMTLWDFQKVMRHSLKQTLIELRRHVQTQHARALTVEAMIGIRERVADEVKGEIWNLEHIRRLAFERTLEYVGHPDKALAAHLNAIYLKHRFEDIILYPDVLPTLDALAPHVALGILSNGNTYPERCGLERRFEFVVFAQDVGVEKPARRIFEITARKAGCPLTALLHVGDSLESDVAGARTAGAYAIWLNREGIPNHTDIRADYEIASLDEIPAILGVL